MRILLAHQGPLGTPPVTLIGTRSWPWGTTVQVVTVLDLGTGAMPTFPRVGAIVDRWHQVLARATGDVDAAVQALRASGLEAEGIIEYGRPGPTIAALCRRLRPDLLVVGAWVGALDDGPDIDLAAEFVDRAPCPVLVARRPAIRHVVLCTDGSRAAREAERFVDSSPMLHGLPVTVLSVVEPHPLVSAMLGPHATALDGRAAATRLERHRQFALDAAARLAESGRRARAQLATGPIGSQVDSITSAGDADLVVLGADARRGWSRVLVGSVAREVLLNTRVSLLVVPTTTRRTERADRVDGWRSRAVPTSMTLG